MSPSDSGAFAGKVVKAPWSLPRVGEVRRQVELLFGELEVSLRQPVEDGLSSPCVSFWEGRRILRVRKNLVRVHADNGPVCPGGWAVLEVCEYGLRLGDSGMMWNVYTNDS